MTSTEEARDYAATVMSMIREDQDSGQVPADVISLDELDNFVDVEDYFRQARVPAGDHEAAALRAAVSVEVERCLRAPQSGPWHVIWKRPGGGQSDIGRAAGYVTQEEAEAVGRSHVGAEGGGFRLRRAD